MQKQTNAKNDVENTLRNYLNPYIAHLQQKYHDQIRIHADAFMKIELSRIDMFVLQNREPYPVVPAFPVLTSEHSTDYGEEM